MMFFKNATFFIFSSEFDRRNKSIHTYSHADIPFGINVPLEQFLPLFKGSSTKHVCKIFRGINIPYPWYTHDIIPFSARFSWKNLRTY